jgi:hypothetical protein
MEEVPEMERREDRFHLRQNDLTKNKEALEEYRQRWTSGNHNFDRTYLGSEGPK